MQGIDYFKSQNEGLANISAALDANQRENRLRRAEEREVANNALQRQLTMQQIASGESNAKERETRRNNLAEVFKTLGQTESDPSMPVDDGSMTDEQLTAVIPPQPLSQGQRLQNAMRVANTPEALGVIKDQQGIQSTAQTQAKGIVDHVLQVHKGTGGNLEATKAILKMGIAANPQSEFTPEVVDRIIAVLPDGLKVQKEDGVTFVLGLDGKPHFPPSTQPKTPVIHEVGLGDKKRIYKDGVHVETVPMGKSPGTEKDAEDVKTKKDANEKARVAKEIGQYISRNDAKIKFWKTKAKNKKTGPEQLAVDNLSEANIKASETLAQLRNGEISWDEVRWGDQTTPAETSPAAPVAPKHTAVNKQGVKIYSDDGINWKDDKGKVVK